MKTRFIIAVLCGSLFFTMRGQTVNSSFAQDINNRFSLLEKNRVPHHILLDYGFDIIDATKFDGVLRTDNYITIGTFNELFKTIVSSATSTSASGLSSPRNVKQEWASLQKNDHKKNRLSFKASVVLNGLLFNYSRFDPNALNNNKIQITNGKYDDKYINGIWQNPYLTNIAFAITSPVSYINSANVEVRLPSTLWHSNQSITHIQIDFGNGSGYKSLNNGIIASTNYSTDGTYTWTYRVRLSNGQYKYSRQKVIVQFQEKTITTGDPNCGGEDRVSLIAKKAYLGEFGSATLEIVYNTNGCTLTRPLIVAEGLDTGLLGQAGSLGDNSLNDFIRDISFSESTDLQNLLLDDNNINSYDIVYVNWDNGTDYIQRNAYVLEEVIKYVNEEKALAGSTEENVVLGQSMGGLIARYALRDMEDNNNPHDTDLYISHDSPHQGAHIPLGLLYLARHVGDVFLQTSLGTYNFEIENTGNFSLLDISDLLDAPAVRQMLINYVDDNLDHSTSYNTTWQTQLKSKGYPLQTRNIALSNASHCSETQGLVSNELIADISFDGGTDTLVDLVLFVTGLGSLVGDFFDDSPTFLLGFLPGKTSLEGDFQAKAFPSTGTANIYYGKLTYEKTLLWLVPIRRTLSQRSFNSVGNLFLDNYPGGVNPVGSNFMGSDYESGILGYYNYDVSFNPNFDFIPATSALDVGSGNTTLSPSDHLKVYSANNPPTGSKTIPFVNFTTSFNQNNTNEPHISFNSLNGDWLAEEMDANTAIDIFDCTFVCSTLNITGSDNVCSSQTYSVQSGNANVDWSSGSSKINISNSTTGQVVISPASSSARGNVTLTATISSPDCGSTTISKNLYVGKPYANLPQAENICTNQFPMNHYELPASEGAESYRLVSFSPNLTIGGMSEVTYYNAPALIDFISTSPGTYLVELFTTNECGESRGAMYVTSETCGLGGPGGFNVYPNPASKEVNIEANPEKSNSTYETQSLVSKPSIQLAKLYDFYGGFVKDIELDPYGTTKLDVSNLKEGKYFLKIQLREEEETYKIIVRR